MLMTGTSGNRIEGITKLQSVCIFLVVVIHSLPIAEMDGNPTWVVHGHHFITLFIMPLFMFLSGYLFLLTNLDREISFPRFMLSKAKRLLIPYFVLTSVAFVIKCIFSRYAVRPITFDLDHYVRGLFYPLENPIILFWFLPTLFLIFMLAPLIKRLLVWNNKFVIVAILLMMELLFILNPVRIRFLNLIGVAEYLIFFYTGCLFCRYFKDRVQYLGRALVVIPLFALLFVGNEILMKYQNPVLRLHLAFLGIIFSFALAYALVRLKWNITRQIDGYYYQIYLLSWFPQGFGRTMFKIGVMDYYVTLLLMLAAGLVVPVLCAKLVVKKITPMKVLIGIK